MAKRMISVTLLVDGARVVRSVHELMTSRLGMASAQAPTQGGATSPALAQLSRYLTPGEWCSIFLADRVVLNLVDVPFLTRARSLLRKQPRARLLNIETDMPSVLPLEAPFSIVQWTTTDDPPPPPSFSVSVSSATGAAPPAAGDGSGLVTRGVKELVLGHAEAEDELWENVARVTRDVPRGEAVEKGCHNVASTCASGEQPVLRVLPSPTSLTAVLKVESLERSRRHLEQAGLASELIGRSSRSQGQLVVPGLSFPGFEVRLDEAEAVSAAFVEGESTLREGVIVQRPEARQAGGAGPAGAMAVTAAAGEGAAPRPPEAVGDCWMEVRAMLQKPGGFLR